eukprot:8253632-Lingulodinium_polyedra.AAC.1
MPRARVAPVPVLTSGQTSAFVSRGVKREDHEQQQAREDSPGARTPTGEWSIGEPRSRCARAWARKGM